VLNQKSKEQQLLYLNKLQYYRNNVNRIVIEYGNKCKNDQSKISYTTFCKDILRDGISKNNNFKISKVNFNINPGYEKPTSSLQNKNDKILGYTFE